MHSSLPLLYIPRAPAERWPGPFAGGKQLPFDRKAIGEMHRLFGGIARDMCNRAHETLLRAVVLRRKVTDRDLVKAAAADAFEEVFALNPGRVFG